MILTVKPRRNAEELRRISSEITRGIVSGSKEELAERLTGIAAGALAFDGSREKPFDVLDQLQALFPTMKPDNPAAVAIEASRTRLETFQGWSILRDVDAAPDKVEPFPLDAFPPPFCDYIANAAEHAQVDPAGIGAALLAIAAGSAQHRFVVTHPSGNGHKEALCLYVCIVGASGGRKTASFNAVKPLLNRFISEKSADYAAKSADFRAARQAAEARKQAALALLKSPKTTTDSARESAERALQAAERTLDGMKPPTDPCFISAGNVTPEGICERLDETGGTLVILDSEAHFLNILQGAYTKPGAPANIDSLLESYDGEDLQVIRAGGRRITTPKAHISIALYSQPDVFSRFFGNAELIGRGMVPRFLIAKMQFRPIYEDHCIQLDSDLLTLCSDRLAEILDTPLADEPPVIDWTPDARAEIMGYTQTLQDARRPGGSMSDPADSAFAGKQPGACYRIAALLHLLAEGTEAAEGIGTETARRAVKLHRYFWNARADERTNATRTTSAAYQITLDTLLSLTFDAPEIRGSCTLSELWRECRDHHRAIFGTDSADRERFYAETVPELAAMGYIDAVQREKSRAIDVYLNPACIDLD